MSTMPLIDLAPIQGVTNALYRKLYHHSFGGVDRFFTPFVKIQKPHPASTKKKKVLFPDYDPALPVVPQLITNDSEEMLIFDHDLHEAGYPVFNWNLGCPSPTVTHKKRGSGLLPYPDKIKSILENSLHKMHCHLSIKTRLGFKQPNELMDLIPILNKFPIQELIIHPRLGRQLYNGQVDLKIFGKCLNLSKHKVIYNGDIFNLSRFNYLQDHFPSINHWMFGRGLLANPFLPEQVKAFDISEASKLERLINFHDEYINQYKQILSGPGHLMDKLKEFWSYLHFIFEGGHVFYHRMIKLKRYAEYDKLVSQFFSHQPAIIDHLDLSSEDFK